VLIEKILGRHRQRKAATRGNENPSHRIGVIHPDTSAEQKTVKTEDKNPLED